MELEGKEMALTEKKYKTNKRYNDKTYDRLGFVARKDERLDELIELGADKTNQTKSMYMKNAILSQLSRDGITIDMLPVNAKYTPPQPEPQAPKQYMIYMITEHYIRDPDETKYKYIATFPTLKATEKYVRSKFEKKAYPADWEYMVLGRYMEGDNQRDAYIKLSEVIKEELETDRQNKINGVDDLTYWERINLIYPTEYLDIVRCEDEDAKSEWDEDGNLIL